MAKGIAMLDSKVVVLIIGVFGIISLIGMTLDYDIDLRILGSGIRLSKPNDIRNELEHQARETRELPVAI